MEECMHLKRALRPDKAISPCKILCAVLASLITLSSFSILQTKASSINIDAVANPVTLFEIPGEMRVTFQVCLNDESFSPAKIDFQLGETVFLRLTEEMYRHEYHPRIANSTVFVVTDSVGTIVWNTSMCEFGGGLFEITAAVVRWTPEKAGDYFAGVVLQETNFPSDFINVIPFRVLNPCPFTGKVTELDNVTPISNAILEALQGNEVKAKVTTDSEGHFTMQLEKAETYDVRVSVSGYVTTVFKRLATRLENTSLVFSLAPVSLSPTFNTAWTKPLENNYRAVVDLEGNIVTAEGMGTVIVSKFDSEGNVLWNISSCFSGQWESLESIAVDSSKNIFLLLSVVQDTNYDFCTVKLDPSGSEIWAKMFDSGENDFGRELAVNSQDSVLVAGNIYGSGHREGALAIIKYDSEGNLDRSEILTGSFELGALVIDGENNVILAGSTYRNLTDMDYYVAKLDIDCTLVWEQTLNSDGSQRDCGKGVALDSSGNIVVIGDQFVVKLDPNGNRLWSRYFTGKDVVVDANDNIIAIDGPFIEIFNPGGHFIGQSLFANELHSIVFDVDGNLVVAGAQFMAKISYAIPQTLNSNGSAQRGAVANQVPYLKSAEPQLSSVSIIPSLVIAILLIEFFFRKKRNPKKNQV